MAYLRKNQQKALAKSQTVGKRQGLQDKKEPMVKPQTLKEVSGKYLNLQAKWQNQKFKALVDNKATRNHISPAIIEKRGLFYK